MSVLDLKWRFRCGKHSRGTQAEAAPDRSTRTTFMTIALENGARFEDVRKAAGRRDPSTTKLYDRCGQNPC